MIESLLRPENVERKPWEAFIAGFLFTITACFITMQLGVTGTGTGFLVVAFISIAAAPFFIRIFEIEERKSEDKKNLFGRHSDVLEVFAFFFISVIFSSSLFFVLAGTSASNTLFSDQTLDLCSKGLAVDDICAEACDKGEMSSLMCEKQITGNALTFKPDFWMILENNLIVLALAVLFSLLLGAGAVYLITWNATIIGVLIAKIAQSPELYGSVSFGEHTFMNYLIALPVTILRILPHGMFEFGGYFFGAVAGGILSVAMVKDFNCIEKVGRFKIRCSMKDALMYLVISVALIVIGAAIEVIL